MIKTRFLKNVCQLVITKASPKQPQSVTGLYKAMYKVSGVITSIKSMASMDVRRNLILKSKFRPITSSSTGSATPSGSARKLKPEKKPPKAVR